MPGDHETEMKESFTEKNSCSIASSFSDHLSLPYSVSMAQFISHQIHVFIFSTSSFLILYIGNENLIAKLMGKLFWDSCFNVCYFGEKNFPGLSYALRKNQRRGPLPSHASVYKFLGEPEIQPTSNSVWQRQHLLLEAFNNLKNPISTYALLF